jgi:hypothetical protein
MTEYDNGVPPATDPFEMPIDPLALKWAMVGYHRQAMRLADDPVKAAIHEEMVDFWHRSRMIEPPRTAAAPSREALHAVGLIRDWEAIYSKAEGPVYYTSTDEAALLIDQLVARAVYRATH